jgi:hypothetical protein
MIQKNLADPPAISPEEEARLDLEQRSAADDLLRIHFDRVMLNIDTDNLEILLHNAYYSSGDDELLAVNDLKSLLFDTALEIVKRGK